jgi:hypothetical protein
LTFLFLPQLLDYLFHNQSPRSLRKILTTRTYSSRLSTTEFQKRCTVPYVLASPLFTPKNPISFANHSLAAERTTTILATAKERKRGSRAPAAWLEAESIRRKRLHRGNRHQRNEG